MVTPAFTFVLMLPIPLIGGNVRSLLLLRECYILDLDVYPGLFLGLGLIL